MYLELRRVREEGVAFDHGVELSGLRGDTGEPLLVGPARLRGEAVRDGTGVDMRARVEAVVRLPCSRCLELFEVSVDAEFELRLVPDAVEFGAGGESRMDVSDATLFYATEGKVEFSAVAAEQIQLVLPLKPVCREDCAGLCPTCGANRNALECGCRRAEVDPRLAPLIELKNGMKGGKDDGESQA